MSRTGRSAVFFPVRFVGEDPAAAIKGPAAPNALATKAIPRLYQSAFKAIARLLYGYCTAIARLFTSSSPALSRLCTNRPNAALEPADGCRRARGMAGRRKPMACLQFTAPGRGPGFWRCLGSCGRSPSLRTGRRGGQPADWPGLSPVGHARPHIRGRNESAFKETSAGCQWRCRRLSGVGAHGPSQTPRGSFPATEGPVGPAVVRWRACWR